jgi:hypothetical protein
LCRADAFRGAEEHANDLLADEQRRAGEATRIVAGAELLREHLEHGLLRTTDPHDRT